MQVQLYLTDIMNATKTNIIKVKKIFVFMREDYNAGVYIQIVELLDAFQPKL